MIKVYIVGEDPVTYTIIKKVLFYCSDQIKIISELPARGGEVKNKVSKFNRLSEHFPVILLMDLDNYTCAPELLDRLISNKNKNFIFNIAVDEAEAWLMADREGFSRYFSIDLNLIPKAIKTKQGGRKALKEMEFPYKSSMFFTHNLVPKSRNANVIRQFTPITGAAKGPEYNFGMLPFIQDFWDIDNAKSNSDSLNRMIDRIKRLESQ